MSTQGSLGRCGQATVDTSTPPGNHSSTPSGKHLTTPSGKSLATPSGIRNSRLTDSSGTARSTPSGNFFNYNLVTNPITHYLAASNNNTSSFNIGTIASESRNKNKDIFGNIILCTQLVEQHETLVGHSPNADTATSAPCPNKTKMEG